VKRYLSWIKTWEFVNTAARKADKSAVGKLRQLLQSTSSSVLKDKIIWAFERIRSLETAGDLISLLESDSKDERGRAYSALKYITGQNIPFTASGSAATRKGQVAKWREWLAGKGL